MAHTLTDAQLTTRIAQLRAEKSRATKAARYDPSGGSALIAADAAVRAASDWEKDDSLTALLNEQQLRLKHGGKAKLDAYRAEKAVADERRAEAKAKSDAEAKLKAAEPTAAELEAARRHAWYTAHKDEPSAW